MLAPETYTYVFHFLKCFLSESENVTFLFDAALMMIFVIHKMMYYGLFKLCIPP